MLRRRFPDAAVPCHSGSGKSTELRWLAHELLIPKDGEFYLPLFVDVDDYLDASDVQLPEFLTAIFTALIDEQVTRQLVSASRRAQALWNDVSKWLKAAGLDLGAELGVGPAKLKFGFKATPGLQHGFRDVAWKYLSSMMAALGELIVEVRNGLEAQGYRDLVLIADNLERIIRRPMGKDDPRTTHDLFFLDQLPAIQSLPLHMVLTIPVSLHFTQGRMRNSFRNSTSVVLPMVAVHERTKQATPNPVGIAALRRLLARRIDLTAVFADDAAVTHAIMLSGGCIRDLLRLVAQCTLIKPALALTVAEIDDVTKDAVGSMERLLQGRSFLPLLHHIVETGSFPTGIDEATRQWLLVELVVLEYNGETWFDLHPFACRTHAFKQALMPPKTTTPAE